MGKREALQASHARSAFTGPVGTKMSFALDSLSSGRPQGFQGGKQGPCRCGAVGFCQVLLTCNLVSWVCFLCSTMTSMVWAGGSAGCLEKDLRTHLMVWAGGSAGCLEKDLRTHLIKAAFFQFALRAALGRLSLSRQRSLSLTWDAVRSGRYRHPPRLVDVGVAGGA